MFKPPMEGFSPTFIDVHVTGNLTVDGDFSFGSASVQSLFIGDDDLIKFGNTSAAPDVTIGWNTAQTADAFFLGLATAQNTFVIAENGDRAFDFAHGAQTNPTMFIHSAVQSTSQWISFTHNQLNAAIGVGVGGLVATMPTITSSGTDDFGFRISQILNDAGAPGGADIYRGIDVNLTNTNITGWNTVKLTDLRANGNSIFSIVKDATYGWKMVTSDESGNQFQVLNYQEGATTPRTAWYGGQDAADISWILRIAHKDSTVGSEITCGFSIDTIAENSPANAHRLGLFSTSANATISTRSGIGNGLPLYLGTATTAATSLIKIEEVVNGQGFELHPSAVASGMPIGFLYVGAAHLGLAAATEVPSINFNLVPTKTWAAGAGPLIAQRDFLIQAPNYAGNAGGALTITQAATFAITGAPTAGANMTITETMALWIQAGNTRFDGGVLVGTTANFINFTNTKMVVSQADTGATGTAYRGIVGEALAVNGVGAAYGVSGYGKAVGDQWGYGLSGVGLVDNTADTGSVVGVYGSAVVTHAGGNNIAVYAGATNGATNYAFYGIAGLIFNSTDIIIYEAVNDGNPEFRIGSTDAEELHVQTVYDAGAQTLDYVKFTTDVASATADKGKFIFNVDGTDIFSIVDAGLSFGKATDFSMLDDNGSALAFKEGANTYMLFDTRNGIENIFVNKPLKMNNRFLGLQGADVASQSTIALGDGNSFELTGTTAVNLITSTGWQDGSIVTLVANENVTINHGTATSGADITILLAGSLAFSMTANDTLTLILCSTTAGGQAWREICRTAI